MSLDRTPTQRDLPRALLLALLMAGAYGLYQRTPLEYWPLLNATALILLLVLLAARALGRSSQALARSRHSEDLPTSRIRAAAQGYVELQGTAQPADDGALRCPVGGSTCLWWEHRLWENQPLRAGLQHRVTDSSDQPFLLEDDTGRCHVLPAGATVIGLPVLRWYGGRAVPERIPDPAVRALQAVLLWPAYHLAGRILLAAVLVELLLDELAIGLRWPTTGEWLVLGYCLLAMTRYRFRHELRLLPPFRPLHALGEFNSQVLRREGQAVEALVQPRASDQAFILSTQPIQRLERRSRRRAGEQLLALLALTLALGYLVRAWF